MTRFLATSAALLGLALQGDSAAQAATVLRDYALYRGAEGEPVRGNRPGLMQALSITVQDQITPPEQSFYDVLSITDVALSTFTAVTFYLSYANAGDQQLSGPGGTQQESWSVYSSTNGSTTLGAGGIALGQLSAPHEFSLTLSRNGTAEESAVFDRLISTGEFAFWFGETTDIAAEFQLKRAALHLTTLAPVPVPAAGLLLMGALGGLALLRRRRSAA